MTKKTYDLVEKLVACQKRDGKDYAYARALGNLQAILCNAKTIEEVDSEVELLIKYLTSNADAREKSSNKV
jgi:3-methyladenine DNA glycosylase Tag